MNKLLKEINYQEISKSYYIYNPELVNEEPLNKNKGGCIIANFFSHYVKNIQKFRSKVKETFKNRIIRPIISTTERVVDMVLSVRLFE